MNSEESAILQGKIVEWNLAKGFGYLRSGKKKLFIHRRDFSEHHKKPEIGDRLRFTIGKDARGRTCATNALHVNDGGRITFLNFLVVIALLVLPAFALYQRDLNLLWAGGYVLVIGTLAYRVYSVDKKRARAKEWRISEQFLHLLELAGGWPGAFLAQRGLRHKCSKGSYQFMFWLIVIAYEFAAFDSLQNWQLSRKIGAKIEAAAKSR